MTKDIRILTGSSYSELERRALAMAGDATEIVRRLDPHAVIEHKIHDEVHVLTAQPAETGRRLRTFFEMSHVHGLSDRARDLYETWGGSYPFAAALEEPTLPKKWRELVQVQTVNARRDRLQMIAILAALSRPR